MDSRFAALVREQLATDFVDLEGAHLSATVPIAERLINEAIARGLPPDGALRSLHVHPRDGNCFDVQIKLAKPSFLPAVNVTAVVDRQARIPESPVLVLRLSSVPGLISAAGFGAGLFNVLPPGVTLDGDRVNVDLRVLLQQHGLGAAWPFIERADVTSTEGRVVLELGLRIARR
jgi:hypothetical protein